MADGPGEHAAEKDEYLVARLLPKMLSLWYLLNTRGRKVGVKAVEELKRKIPGQVMRYLSDFNEMIFEGMGERLDVPVLETRLDTYLTIAGIGSVEAAEAVVDPSIKRAKSIASEIDAILSRYSGANPFPVVKNDLMRQMGLATYGGDLASDARLEQRMGALSQVMAEEGMSTLDAGSLSLDDVLRMREKIQNKLSEKDKRREVARQVGEAFARYTMQQAESFDVDDAFEKAGMDSLVQNILSQLSKDQRKCAKEVLGSGLMQKLAGPMIKLKMGMVAKMFLSCALGYAQIDCAERLNEKNGIDYEIDGQKRHLSPAEYVHLLKEDLLRMQAFKDYLVDRAMQDGVESAITDQAMEDGLRKMWNGDKNAFIANKRLLARFDHVVGFMAATGRKPSYGRIAKDPAYKAFSEKNDTLIRQQADKIFGE